ncbi:MAG: hypothetical protein AAB874_01940 [Patescibacteria group bacterium]
MRDKSITDGDMLSQLEKLTATFAEKLFLLGEKEQKLITAVLAARLSVVFSDVYFYVAKRIREKKSYRAKRK